MAKVAALSSMILFDYVQLSVTQSLQNCKEQNFVLLLHSLPKCIFPIIFFSFILSLYFFFILFCEDYGDRWKKVIIKIIIRKKLHIYFFLNNFFPSLGCYILCSYFANTNDMKNYYRFWIEKMYIIFSRIILCPRE